MVWPWTLTAATPVGASTTRRFLVVVRKCCSSVDFPVPARPVRKTCCRVCSQSCKTACASGVSSMAGLAIRAWEADCCTGEGSRTILVKSSATVRFSTTETPALEPHPSHEGGNRQHDCDNRADGQLEHRAPELSNGRSMARRKTLE